MVFTSMNSATPVWTEMEGNAVIGEEQEIDGNFQWAWGAGTRSGSFARKRGAEEYVRALLRVHGASLDPYDQQGLPAICGTTRRRFPDYQYWDLTSAPARWRRLTGTFTR